jgi:hypothetical protein
MTEKSKIMNDESDFKKNDEFNQYGFEHCDDDEKQKLLMMKVILIFAKI